MAIRIEESPSRGIFPELEPVKSRPKQRMWQKLHRLFGRDDSSSPSPHPPANHLSQIQQATANQMGDNLQSSTRRDFGRRVGVGLPRPGTFRRQNSEKRDRLEPNQLGLSERRAVSAHRQQRAISACRPRSVSTPSSKIPSRVSAPSLSLVNDPSGPPSFINHASLQTPSPDHFSLNNDATDRSASSSRSTSQSSERFDERARDEKHQIDLELDTKWILNLSMHFRDKSDREKFFVTFAEEPNRWRRVTISCDYRNSEPDSLETDLKELQYQRDKNAQIYESIRDSLPSIQFYNTVTNLKLETQSGRLHVHVTEDVNEIIPYPPRLSIQHLLVDRSNPIREARESQITFLSHLSGFVYKVGFQGREYIKKEIPGPDTVDEFLYEVNALHALSASTSVIRLEAIVLDDSRQTVKGLLISYAERGALVDLLYEHKAELSWTDRVRWARQAIQGLSEIHEEGYVQGDFTLSNIVINSDNDAKIIDINRRGCPVGWEPPEIVSKIASNQRISMYIGQKSDLYQLGMTLWALAMNDDEPERHDQPLCMMKMDGEIPHWFKKIVSICLSPQPRDRLAAKELLRQFPLLPSDHPPHVISTMNGVLDDRLPKRYIDPCAAVEREDLERLGRRRRRSTSERPSTEEASFIEPPSSSYQFDSGSSLVDVRRREPQSVLESAHDRDSERVLSDQRDIDAVDERDFLPRIISVSPGREPRYEGFHRDTDYGEGNQSRTAAEYSGPEQNQASVQPFNTHEQIMPAIAPLVSMSSLQGTQHEPESQHEPETQALEMDLELPSPHVPPPDKTLSSTSDSTPRNAPSVLATSTSSIVPPSPVVDLATADLAGLGGHPTLEEHCPHEPFQSLDIQSSQYYDTQVEQPEQPRPSDIVSLDPQACSSSIVTEAASAALPTNDSRSANESEPGDPKISSFTKEQETQTLAVPSTAEEEEKQTISMPPLMGEAENQTLSMLPQTEEKQTQNNSMPPLTGDAETQTHPMPEQTAEEDNQPLPVSAQTGDEENQPLPVSPRTGEEEKQTLPAPT